MATDNARKPVSADVSFIAELDRRVGALEAGARNDAAGAITFVEAGAVKAEGWLARGWRWLHTDLGLILIAAVSFFAGIQMLGNVGLFACRVVGG